MVNSEIFILAAPYTFWDGLLVHEKILFSSIAQLCPLNTFIELCVGEIKEKVYFKIRKVHIRANSALLPTKSALLKHNCPRTLSAG